MDASDLSSSSQRFTSCIEIVTILLNDVYHEDPHVVDESLEILSSVETIRRWVLVLNLLAHLYM